MERHIEAEKIELVISLFGSFDENVRIIEKELDVAIINRGSDIKIGGEPENVDRAVSAVNALLSMASKGDPIWRTGGSLCYVTGGERQRGAA